MVFTNLVSQVIIPPQQSHNKATTSNQPKMQPMEMSFLPTTQPNPPITTYAPSALPSPPTLPSMALVLSPQDTAPLIKTQAELDEQDCKVAVNDLKGKIRDTIIKMCKGQYKSSVKDFMNALEHLDIDPASKLFLRTHMLEEIKNKNITKANGTISYASQEYVQVLLDTLMECKKRTGVIYRNNTKHPLRTRPDKKQTMHPYKKDTTSTVDAIFGPNKPSSAHLSTNEPVVASHPPQGFTVDTLPPLQPSTQSVNMDDPCFTQRISNLCNMSRMAQELAQKYEAARAKGMSPENKEQFHNMMVTYWKFMRTAFE